MSNMQKKRFSTNHDDDNKRYHRVRDPTQENI